MNKTVLIIEDNPIQAEMVKSLVLVVDSTVVVYTANDIKTAYEILMEKTIDVFLVDIVLDLDKPGDMSGIRLVKKFRGIPKYMFTPVVFISSLEDSSGYVYKDLHCLGYIEKPFSPDSVKRIVEKALYYSTSREKDAMLYFRKDGIIYPVKVKDVVYMESVNHNVEIHMANGNLLAVPYKTCKALLDEADSNCLIQCSVSQQIIIPTDCIFTAH